MIDHFTGENSQGVRQILTLEEEITLFLWTQKGLGNLYAREMLNRGHDPQGCETCFELMADLVDENVTLTEILQVVDNEILEDEDG